MGPLQARALDRELGEGGGGEIEHSGAQNKLPISC